MLGRTASLQRGHTTEAFLMRERSLYEFLDRGLVFENADTVDLKMLALSEERIPSSSEFNACDISGLIDASVRWWSSVPYLCLTTLCISG